MKFLQIKNNFLYFLLKKLYIILIAGSRGPFRIADSHITCYTKDISLYIIQATFIHIVNFHPLPYRHPATSSAGEGGAHES